MTRWPSSWGGPSRWRGCSRRTGPAGDRPGPARPRPPWSWSPARPGSARPSLLHRFTAEVEAAGATVAWGTCWDDAQAPAWWPWTEALRGLTAARPDSRPPGVGPMLSTRGRRPTKARESRGSAAAARRDRGAGSPRSTVTSRWSWCSTTSSGATPRLWTCCASWSAGRRTAGCCWSAATGPARRRPEVAAALAELAVSAELVPLASLTEAEVTDLVRAVAGADAAARWSDDGAHAAARATRSSPASSAGCWPPARIRRRVPPVVRDVVATPDRDAVRRLHRAARRDGGGRVGRCPSTCWPRSSERTVGR